jgi:hypothetical protein
VFCFIPIPVFYQYQYGTYFAKHQTTYCSYIAI